MMNTKAISYLVSTSSKCIIITSKYCFAKYIMEQQDRRWNADKPSATLDP